MAGIRGYPYIAQFTCEVVSALPYYVMGVTADIGITIAIKSFIKGRPLFHA